MPLNRTSKKSPAPWAALLTAAVVLAGCQTAPTSGAGDVSVAEPTLDDTNLRLRSGLRPQSPQDAPVYLLQPGDELDLQFADRPNLTQTLRVRPDGHVSVAQIGGIRAQGRTVDQLQSEILARYRDLAGESGEREYLIQTGDEFEVKFAFLPQFNDRVQVRPDGKIALQMIGALKAQGLTPETLQDELTRRYARILKKPDLTVVMRTFNTATVRLAAGPNGQVRYVRSGLDDLRPTLSLKTSAPLQVFIGGEVQRPGVVAWRPGLTLVQALMEGGGQLPTAALANTMVLRKTQGREPLLIRRDLRRDLTGSGTQDIVLEASDIVVLPRTGVATVAQALDQYVYKLIPIHFNMTYDLRRYFSN